MIDGSSESPYKRQTSEGFVARRWLLQFASTADENRRHISNRFNSGRQTQPSEVRVSLAATNWAWGTTVKHPSQKMVLLALADCLNGKTQACFPSSSYLRKMTGLSNGSVFLALEALKKDGLIGVVKRKGHSSEYILALNNLSSHWRTPLQPLENTSPAIGEHLSSHWRHNRNRTGN